MQSLCYKTLEHCAKISDTIIPFELSVLLLPLYTFRVVIFEVADQWTLYMYPLWEKKPAPDYKSSLRKSGNENKKEVEINIVLGNILDLCFHMISHFWSGTNKGMQTKHLSSNALK